MVVILTRLLFWSFCLANVLDSVSITNLRVFHGYVQPTTHYFCNVKNVAIGAPQIDEDESDRPGYVLVYRLIEF